LHELKFVKQVEDVRGKIIFCSYGNSHVNIVEIKKGFARGGHYHDFESDHVIVIGKVEYREEDIHKMVESSRTVSSPAMIHVPPNTAHMLTALEDTVFIESFPTTYRATDYRKYRRIIEEKMKI
jgi:dTDP-4-dehydrorhamnose 3,5-epimerase-like enzyme